MADMPPQNAQQLAPWAQKCLNWISRLGHPIVLSTVAASAIVLGARTTGSLQGLELGVYDQMLRLRPAIKSDERILVVGIDETDIQVRGEWPIEDKTLAELLQTLLAAEPRTIGLDFFRDVPIGEGQESLLNVIQTSDRIVPVCRMSGAENPGVPPPRDISDFQVGFADLVVDPGGILRRTLLVAQPAISSNISNGHICSDPNVQLFSLSLQLALQYLATDGINAEPTEDQEIKLRDVVLHRLGPNIGGYRNVEATGYQLLLNFRSAQDAVPVVSLRDVLAGQVPAATIRDRVILVGATTPEAKDDFYTPYSGGLRDGQKMPGVIVHAQAVSQILSAVLDDRPLLWSWPTVGEGFWIILWAAGGALYAWYIRRPLGFTLGAFVLLSSLYGGCYFLLLQGGWIPIIPPALSLSLAAGGVILLDRFSKSDYGQAVYKQMKSLLRLEIEIDQTIVGKQVSEITETEYFSSLQQQARQLRKRSDASNASDTSESPRDSQPSAELNTTQTNTQDDDDYFENLKQEARRLKRNDSAQSDNEDK
ncbi:MAG: CHASE2 domain-containing protein [Cyanobacteria bacterium P01_F01_bin.86]